MSAEKLTLRIAVKPTKELAWKIRSWLEKNLGEKVDLDFIVEPNLIGGAIIEFRGRYGDYSVLKKISADFKADFH